MKLEIAKPENSKDLAEFFKSFVIHGTVEIKIDRMGNFFAPYDIQSEQHITYQLSTSEGIEGVASFLIKDVAFNGDIARVAIGKDLRISTNRRAVLEWSQHFLPVLEELKSTLKVQHFFSILSMSDLQALNAFVRPRDLKRPLPRYHLFRRFNIVSLHGQFPWAKNPLPHLRIRRGGPHNVDALIDYIVKKSKERDLSTVYGESSFYDKWERWKGLKLEDFLIAFDAKENIIGCVAPWSSGGVQEFIPMSYSLPAHNFRQFLKFGKLLGWTRPLTKPYSRLKMEASFNFKYLNFLFANNPDIFEALLWKAYRESKENEFLVYAQLRSEFQFRPPLTWISASLPFGLYALLHPEQEPPDFLNPRNERPIEIEPFLTL